MASSCNNPSPSLSVQWFLDKILCLIRPLIVPASGSSSATLLVSDPVGAPALNAEEVTPNDATTWSVDECHSLWVGTAGTLVLTMANGDDKVFTVPDGVWMPIRPTCVKVASTATDIVRVWN